MFDFCITENHCLNNSEIENVNFHSSHFTVLCVGRQSLSYKNPPWGIS